MIITILYYVLDIVFMPVSCKLLLKTIIYTINNNVIFIFICLNKMTIHCNIMINNNNYYFNDIYYI